MFILEFMVIHYFEIDKYLKLKQVISHGKFLLFIKKTFLL